MKKNLITYFTLTFCFQLNAHANFECFQVLTQDSTYVLNTAEKLTKNSIKTLEDQLRFTNKQVKDLENSFFIEDPSDIIQDRSDPLVNKISPKSVEIMLGLINEHPDLNIKNWQEYLTIFPRTETLMIEQIYDTMDESVGEREVSDEEMAELEQVMNKAMSEVPIMKYLGGSTHNTIYNPLHGIIIDVSYRHFLFGKIPPNKFKKLPKVFVGTLEEFRALLSPFISDEGVDRVFTASQTDAPGFIDEDGPSKPTLLELEQGVKTITDIPKPTLVERPKGVFDLTTEDLQADMQGFIDYFEENPELNVEVGEEEGETPFPLGDSPKKKPTKH